jgi:glycosyltransferase involved in cell wall biosynthesis
VKILAISPYGVLGGAELALAAFIEHRPTGNDVSALLMDDGPLRQRLNALAVPVKTWPEFNRRPNPRLMLRFTARLAPLLRRNPPDVVWATGQKSALLAAPSCRIARVPLVWHKVDLMFDSWLARPLALLVDGVIGVSDAALVALGRVGKRRILGTVAPPVCLSPSLISRPDPSHPRIGTLARLAPYKGLHHIIGAAALLRKEFPTLRVVLAGARLKEYPSYPRELQSLVCRLDLEQHVELPGFVEPSEVLSELSVFVNATYLDEHGYGLEGLPGAILEASWAGVPVVATGVGGTAEAVRDGETGTLVEECKPEQLAEAIAVFLRDRDRARAAGAAGRAFAQSFAPELVAPRLFALLEGLPRSRSVGPGSGCLL